MSDARGSQAFIGIAEQDNSSVPKDPTYYGDATEITAKANREQIEIPTLRPGLAAETINMVNGAHSAEGGFKSLMHPSDFTFLFKHLLGSVTSTQQGGTAAYKHEFLGTDEVYGRGLSILKHLDVMTMHLFGMFANKVTIDAELGQPVYLTWEFVGKDGIESTGTAGTSQGQTAITFPVTLVSGVSDQVNIAIDGGSAVEVTIPAGTYADGAELANAINDNITDLNSGYTGLFTDRSLPIVACRVDTDDKLVWYSASKGTTSSVAWTAGTNDAGVLLGRGIPVEATGAATVTTPIYSTTLPFVYSQSKVKLGGQYICAQKISISIDNGLTPKDCLGKDTNSGVTTTKRTITGTLSKLLTGPENWQTYDLNADSSLDVEIRSNVEADTGYNYDADIKLALIRFGNPEATVSSTEAIPEEITFTAYNSGATYKDFYLSMINLSPTV